MANGYIAVLLFLSFAVYANANEDNDNWPCYLKKCSRNDPNLKTCMINHANRALDSIYAGDNKLGIPSFLPLAAGNLTVGKDKSFKIHIADGTIFGVSNCHVVDMDWNLIKKTINIELRFNTAIRISGNYDSSGTFKNQLAQGKGHIDFIFVGGNQGGNMSYNMNYDLIKVLGQDYVQIKNTKCSYQEALRLDFNNVLISKQETDSRVSFWNKNSKEVNDAIRAEINQLICAVISLVLNPIFYNFPLNLIFDSS